MTHRVPSGWWLALALGLGGCVDAEGRPGHVGGFDGGDDESCVGPGGQPCDVPECDDPCAYNDPALRDGQCKITALPESCGDMRGQAVLFQQLGASVPAPGGVFRPADAALQKWVQARWQEMSQFVVPANVKAQLTKGGVKVWNYPDGNGWIRTDFHAGIMALPPGVAPETVLKAMLDDPLAATGNGEFSGWVGWPKAGAGGRKVGDRVDLDIWGPDNGAIGYWKIDPDRYCVITLENDTAGIHPVNGIRCWGFVPMALNPNWLATKDGKASWGCAGATYMFYTMGIDSPSIAGGGLGADAQAATWNANIRDLLGENVKAGGVSGRWYVQQTIVQPNGLAPGANVQAEPPGELNSYYVQLPERDFRDGEVCEEPATPPSQCGADHFTCIDGQCIDAAWRCDGIADCSDRDDEAACDDDADAGDGGCAATQFACTDGSCIPAQWRCDGEYSDCAAGEDEQDCDGTPGSCAPTQFTCDDGQCIAGDWKCDGIVDCQAGEDESGCTDTPPPADSCDGFACDDGQCIAAAWACDGIVDCQAGDDEADCADTPPGNDACDGFACDDGMCIWAQWQCDGYLDCAGAEDELGCG